MPTKSELISLLRSVGISFHQIATEVDMPVTKVFRLYQQRQMRLYLEEKRVMTFARWKEAYRLYTVEKKTFREIGEIFSISGAQACRYVKNWESKNETGRR
jgi:DNA-directed RNA polymerase specialized sigma subunit